MILASTTIKNTRETAYETAFDKAGILHDRHELTPDDTNTIYQHSPSHVTCVYAVSRDTKLETAITFERIEIET